jgi:hypothetical protein
MLKPSKELETTVSEQDEDEDEIDVLRRDIAREVEEAFANVPYPGDDRLVAYPDYYESDDVIEAFRGKHWRDISPEVLSEHWASLGLFSPEAFRFYLPCYLIAALLRSDVTGMVWETVFFRLTPPESEGDKMDGFLKRINALDARQKAVIRRFVEVYVQIEAGYPDSSRDRALPFWQRISPTESAEGDRDRTKGD